MLLELQSTPGWGLPGDSGHSWPLGPQYRFNPRRLGFAGRRSASWMRRCAYWFQSAPGLDLPGDCKPRPTSRRTRLHRTPHHSSAPSARASATIHLHPPHAPSSPCPCRPPNRLTVWKENTGLSQNLRLGYGPDEYDLSCRHPARSGLLRTARDWIRPVAAGRSSCRQVREANTGDAAAWLYAAVDAHHAASA